MLTLLAYIAVIVLSNYSIQHWGTVCVPNGPCLIPVWIGVFAPSGVIFVGLAFTLRDLVQESLGRVWTLAAIVVGAILSAVLAPSIALASGAAFLVSETLDFLVYIPLRQRGMVRAVFASNIVGLVADSVLFLLLAFGSLDLLTGQVVGKLEMTILAVLVMLARRRSA